jgi:queuine/archaeosine tRNA-ribosyltransferase
MTDVLLWMGEQPTAPIKINRESDLVMDSAFNYYNKENPKLTYNPGELFLDNGAFTANMQGIDLDLQKIIDIQETLDPSKTIPFDYPFRNGMTNQQMEERWNDTQTNIKYWQSSTTLDGKLVPALHSWNKTSLEKNLKWLQKHGDSDYLALGSIVSPDFTKQTGFFGDRQPNKSLVDMLSIAVASVRENTDMKVHLMGLGSSPLTLHFGYYLGIESTDSSGYRRKAAYGQIVLPGTGERYVGNNTATFGGGVQMKRRDIKKLDNCNCPICKVNQDQLWNDWKARAIHNDYVMQKERELAETLIDEGVESYEKYLDKIYGKSSLNYLWEHIKLKKNYTSISSVLFGRK